MLTLLSLSSNLLTSGCIWLSSFINSNLEQRGTFLVNLFSDLLWLWNCGFRLNPLYYALLKDSQLVEFPLNYFMFVEIVISVASMDFGCVFGI